MQYHAGH